MLALFTHSYVHCYHIFCVVFTSLLIFFFRELFLLVSPSSFSFLFFVKLFLLVSPSSFPFLFFVKLFLLLPPPSFFFFFFAGSLVAVPTFWWRICQFILYNVYIHAIYYVYLCVIILDIVLL